MPNTTNFNWATPADTDLVKDGAAAIRTLGSSIDTSFVDLKGGTTGQVLSKASNTDLDFSFINPATGSLTYVGGAAFTSSSTINVNDVFSTTYDNYVVITDYTGSTSDNLSIRFRVAGSDDTTSNYYTQNMYAESTTVAASLNSAQNKATFGSLNVSRSSQKAIFLNPFKTLKSTVMIQGAFGLEIQLKTIFFDDTTSFTGFSILPNSGNITGNVRVYGLANS